MPYIFQTFKSRVNPATGVREPVLDRKGRPVAHDLWRFTYIDFRGDRRTATGARTRAATEDLAARKQVQENEIRLGVRPAPKSYDTAKGRTFADMTGEYSAWGGSQGGRGGRPWGRGHARMRAAHLAFWRTRLGLVTLADLDGVLPRVEAALRELQDAGRTGKTLANYADALRSFCTWCVERGYLPDDPLKGMAAFDATPKTQRRALTPDEIGRLLTTCRERKRLLYATALCSGLRAGELKALKVEHLDALRGGLHLDAAWTKGRRSGFQPLPAALVQELAEASEGKAPDATLLDAPTHTGRTLAEDLESAGIASWAPEGKVDFHSLRVTYVSLVLQQGATLKEAQSLARHATPGLTMNTYGRTRVDRLSALAEDVGKAVFAQNGNTTGTEQKKGDSATLHATGTYGRGDAGSIPAASTFPACASPGRPGLSRGLNVTQAGQRQAVAAEAPADLGTGRDTADTSCGRPKNTTGTQREHNRSITAKALAPGLAVLTGAAEHVARTLIDLVVNAEN